MASPSLARFGRASLIPGWAVSYQRAWLRPDLLCGVTLLAYLVPQVLAYAGLIGLPPVAGLATAVIALLVYAWIGGSRMLSVGPESATAVMAGLVLSPLLARRPEDSVSLTAFLTLCVAAWLGLGALLKAGMLAQLLSRPILTGYLSGAAVLMITSQLGKATRTDSSGSTALTQLRNFLTGVHGIHPTSVAVASATMLLLWAIPRVHPRLPGPLLSVVTMMAISTAFGGAQHGLQELGDVPRGLPPFTYPHVFLSDVVTILVGALGIALVSFSNTMLVARAFAMPGDAVDPNRELRTASAIHAVSGFVGGYPSSASSTRAAIAQRSGQQTQLANVVAAFGLAMVALWAGPIFRHLPMATLAAVVFWAAAKLIAFRDFRSLWRFRRGEFAIALTTTIGTATLGILPGIGIAVVLSAVQILVALARPHEAVQGYVVGKAGLHDVDDYANHATIPGLLIYRYDGPLFAYNADDFRSRLTTIVRNEQPRWIVLNVEANMFVDYSACSTLREIVADLQAQGRVVALARLKLDLETELRAAGVMQLIGEHRYETLPQAILAFQAANPDMVVPPIPGPGEPFMPGAD